MNKLEFTLLTGMETENEVVPPNTAILLVPAVTDMALAVTKYTITGVEVREIMEAPDLY